MAEQTYKKRFIGQVVKAENPKTLIVERSWLQQDRIYKKQRLRRTRFAVHDEHGEASKGDTVLIQDCRPISASKRWILVRKIEKHINADKTDMVKE